METMQATFGMFVGLAEFVPTRAHPYEYVDLEDSGGYALRKDCNEAVDGTYWEDDEERELRDEYLVESLLEDIIECDDDYLISGDCMDMYAESVIADYHGCLDNLKYWLEDNCEGNHDPSGELGRRIFEDLLACAGTEANHSDWNGSSDHDFVIGCVDIGEHEIQVDVDSYPVFAKLAARGDLEAALQNSNYLGSNTRAVYKDGKLWGTEQVDYVSHGSFWMYNNSDIYHWWGCTYQQVWDTCKKHLEDLEYIGSDAVEV